MTINREDTTMPSWDDVKPGDRIDCHYEREDGSTVREENVPVEKCTPDAIRRPEPQYPENGTLCWVKFNSGTTRALLRLTGGWGILREKDFAHWFDSEGAVESWEPVPLVPEGYITIPRPMLSSQTLAVRANDARIVGNNATANLLRSVADAMDAQP